MDAMHAKTLATAALLATLTGCTWVPLEPEGRAVRVARQGEDLAGCQRAGEIAVSVRDRVGFYERDALKVRDELETLARNEALSLRADTVQAISAPLDGEQRFAGFRCGSAAIGSSAARPSPRANGAIGSSALDPAAPADAAATYPAAEAPAPQPAPAEPRPTQGFEPLDDDDRS